MWKQFWEHKKIICALWARFNTKLKKKRRELSHQIELVANHVISLMLKMDKLRVFCAYFLITIVHQHFFLRQHFFPYSELFLFMKS